MSDELDGGKKVVFELVFSQRFVVEASNLQEMQQASASFKKALPFLATFSMGVKETEVGKDEQVRWKVENGSLERIPIKVESIDALRTYKVDEAELAIVEGEGSRYVYQSNVPPMVAKMLDIRFIVASKHGGIWIDAKYLERMMQQMQQQQQHPQQVKAKR